MSGWSAHRRLSSGDCVREAISKSPPFKGGEAAQRPGWLVKSRVASLYARVAILILFEITNHPVCAAKERDLLINGAATPPFKGGEWTRLATTPLPSSESPLKRGMLLSFCPASPCRLRRMSRC